MFAFNGNAPGFAAPAGTVVGVEFLVVPQGCTPISEDDQEQLAQATVSLNTLSPGPQRSNRVVWTVP